MEASTTHLVSFLSIQTFEFSLGEAGSLQKSPDNDAASWFLDSGGRFQVSVGRFLVSVGGSVVSFAAWFPSVGQFLGHVGRFSAAFLLDGVRAH